MSPTRSLLIALSALSLCSGCSPTEGNGFVVTVERHVSALFTKVHVEDGLSVRIVRGTQRVAVTTDDNLADRFVADVDGDTLKLRMTSEKDTSATYADVEVDSELLRGLEVRDGSQVTAEATQSDDWDLKVSGGSTCNLSGVVATKFTLDISGDSQADVSGSTNKANITATGNSRANTEQLRAQDVKIQAKGGSTINANANRQVEIVSSGDSTITITGNPSVNSIKADNGSQVNFQ